MKVVDGAVPDIIVYFSQSGASSTILSSVDTWSETVSTIDLFNDIDLQNKIGFKVYTVINNSYLFQEIQTLFFDSGALTSIIGYDSKNYGKLDGDNKYALYINKIISGSGIFIFSTGYFIIVNDSETNVGSILVYLEKD
jgi:hypothetical protein